MVIEDGDTSKTNLANQRDITVSEFHGLFSLTIIEQTDRQTDLPKSAAKTT